MKKPNKTTIYDVAEHSGMSPKTVSRVINNSPNVTDKTRDRVQASIEQLSIEDGCFDIVISNGAINLSTAKEKVFEEVYRVLVPGGHLYFADMIKHENHSAGPCCGEESWADCVAGTVNSDELIQIIETAGFVDVKQAALTHYKTSDSTIGATFSARKSN